MDIVLPMAKTVYENVNSIKDETVGPVEKKNGP